MPTVTGHLREIAGGNLSDEIGQLVFRLNRPNVGVSGFSKDFVLPTKEHPVTPSSDGSFSVNLNATDQLAYEAWYEVGIVWNETEGTFWDFGLKIQVPNAGGTFGDLLYHGGGNSGGGGGGNQLLVWVNENPPRNPQRGQWWFQPSTNNLSRWE
jgi:hypothetical protein